MSEDTATAGPSTSEAVEELLRQLVDARFVLTDRDGAVTRWSRPAEELFGWPGARMLGRPLVETLSLGIALPETGGRLATTARRKDGHELEVALTLVPVRMSQSLEFNGFLEALEIAAPSGNALAQLQRSHRTVVEWISAAVAGHAELEEDGLAAGTIVAFRPLTEPPPPAAVPDENVPTPATLAVAGQIAEAVEQTRTLRGDADRAAARLEALEQTDAGLDSELADARRVLEEMSAQVEALRAELERARSSAVEQAREERERVRRESEEERGERDRLLRELDDVRGAVEGMRRDLAGAPQAQERLAAQLEQARERLAALEGALSEERGLAEWVDEVHARMAGFEAALAEGAAAQAASEAVDRTAAALRDELAAT
ncbi:MAG: PAS domain-containing protein, partial [Thermoleophilaceae bacterium]